MRYFVITVVGAVLLTLTAACAGAGASAPAPAQATVSVPQVCLDALNEAEASLAHAKTGLGFTAEVADAASAGFLAAAQFDAEAMGAAASRIEGVNAKMGALTPQVAAAVQAYKAAASSCRAVASGS